MRRKPYEQPLPALGLAVGIGVVAHKANVNAARALQIPLWLVSLIVALLILYLSSTAT